MKKCPQCQREFDDDHRDCDDCGCRLLTKHGLDESYPWTLVETFNDDASAKAAALYLSEHDIPAVLRPRYIVPFITVVQTVEMWVPEHMADEAKTLLAMPPPE